MAPRARRFAKKRAPRRPRRNAHKGKSRIPRQMATPNQSAHIVETVLYNDLFPGQMYNLNFNLAQFQRASLLAPNFKYYKPTKVTWQLEPLYNTFQEGGGGGPAYSKPYLFQVMNRTQDVGNFYSLVDLREMGAKPVAFTKTQSMSYSPNWVKTGLTSVLATGGNINSIQTSGNTPCYDWTACPDVTSFNRADIPTIISPDLNLPYVTAGTRTNTVLYGGHYLWIEQTVLGTQKMARLTCTVHWAFKNPNVQHTVGEQRVENVEPQLDLSGNYIN